MKTNVYLGIAIRIVILFAIAIFGTFFQEWINKANPDFFNDIKGNYGVEWGIRHIWYNIGLGLLFTLSLINVVVGSVKLIKNNYDTKNWLT